MQGRRRHTVHFDRNPHWTRRSGFRTHARWWNPLVGRPLRSVAPEDRPWPHGRFASRAKRGSKAETRRLSGLRPGAQDSFLKDNEEVYVGRAKTYYQFAYSYSQNVFRKATAVSDVLEKLSRGFERYVQILSHMRGEYFNLYERMKEERLMSLSDELFSTPDGDVIGLGALRDEFLDAYWAYQQKPDAASRAALEESVTRLKAADPEFGFELPQ